LSLGQASRICPDIADRLGISKMDGHTLDSNGAYNFLTQEAAALKQTGYGVMLPAWWSDRKRNKLLAKPHASTTSKWGGGSIRNSLFNFDWSVALGDQNVTVEELNELAEQKQSLIQVRGEWMEVNADEIRAAIVFMNKYQKKMNLSDMYRMTTEVPDIIEMGRIEADGWLGDMLERLESKNVLEELEQPANFSGTLRPYQIRGYSWLAFLRQYGLGGCLADDMGLGKTIQMLASIQKDWNEGVKRPILLICPMSVMGNWQREAKKFTPELPVMIHHGTARNKGKEFEESVQNNAIIISSYGLLLRDVEMLREVQWGGIVLDEAQNIKNAATKQSRAARTLSSDYRFALTGTPVENNVGDLWSIMEFLNSGILGSQAEFERNFLAPIHARADTDASDKLKRITEPFILRRLKTDKSIISDLPDKIENKVYCTLTKEQASLYVSIQKEAERVMAEEEGIKRKGVILATMSKLKQVCNHPAQLLKDNSKIADRSGKLARLTEMIEEIVQVGDRALIFTQFVEMGTIIKQHLQETLGIEILFLHGSISQKKRDVMVQQFQSTDDDGDVDNPRIFIVSLKAGGTGLNLTAANHVFHFDRWWNPAVENQATDRAFRIGQKQNVQVHKFICAGTMEEAIDDTIEKKKNVAEQVVGTGEGWLTELSNNELREILKLDRTAAYSGSSRKAEDDDSSSDKSTVDTAAGGRKRGRPRKNAKAGGSP